MKKIFLGFVVLFTISACTPTPAPATPAIIPVYSTSAAQPWLSALYDCSGTASVLSRVDDPNAADLVLRVGEPEAFDSPAYQIDTEEILVVTQRQSPVQNLSVEEVRKLFSGLGDPKLQIWVYSSGEDVQEVFDRLVMHGERIAPSAHLAVDPQQMSDTLISEPNAVGIVPRHWKAGDAREVFSLPDVPVFAIMPREPQGDVKALIACLQK
ncbi:MAG: hypothetical protein ACM3XO_14500 [Bacteroidota bacterium]